MHIPAMYLRLVTPLSFTHFQPELGSYPLLLASSHSQLVKYGSLTSGLKTVMGYLPL